jgi:hypothetical protein
MFNKFSVVTCGHNSSIHTASAHAHSGPQRTRRHVHVPGWLVIVSLVGFVRLFLRVGRPCRPTLSIWRARRPPAGVGGPGGSIVLTQQLTEHKLQYASVAVVVHLDGRINAKLDRLINNGTVLACDAQSDILTRRDFIGEPKDVEDFRALQAQGLPVLRSWT